MKAWKKSGAVVLSAVMVISAISVPAGAKTAVKLNKKEVSLTVGKSVTLKVTGTKQKVSWSTSDKKVASVTVKGKVTAKSEGSAVIRARVNIMTNLLIKQCRGD